MKSEMSRTPKIAKNEILVNEKGRLFPIISEYYTVITLGKFLFNTVIIVVNNIENQQSYMKAKLILYILSLIMLTAGIKSQEMENLGENVNSSASEINPMITVDGKTLYFIRSSTSTNGLENQEIWKCEADETGSWGKAENLGDPFNKGDVNNIISITPDGNTIVFTRGFYNNQSMETFITSRNGDSWDTPKKYVNNFEFKFQFKYVRYSHYCYSGTGKVMLVSTNNSTSDDDTFGEIYVCFKKGDVWTKGVKLPEPINVNEGKWGQHDPFLASDDVTLYFASERKGGLGGLDIWMSKRLDETWLKWSQPVNMGPLINTDRSESYYSISAKGDFAYLVSSSTGFGGDDIYRFRLSEGFRPNAVVLVSGKVINAETRSPIGAEINYYNISDGTIMGTAHSNTGNGFYRIVLPYGIQYSFLANSPNYYAISNYIDLSVVDEYKEINVDIEMKPVKVGETIRLNNVFFDFDKATLRPESFQELDRVVALLTENPTIEIELAGHTDNVGSDAYNLSLSQQRANSVTQYLISKGISSGRVTPKGYGESVPVATNDTDEGRQLNRRVEFKILKK